MTSIPDDFGEKRYNRKYYGLRCTGILSGGSVTHKEGLRRANPTMKVFIGEKSRDACGKEEPSSIAGTKGTEECRYDAGCGYGDESVG
jgi:hypothetical protein